MPTLTAVNSAGHLVLGCRGSPLPLFQARGSRRMIRSVLLIPNCILALLRPVSLVLVCIDVLVTDCAALPQPSLSGGSVGCEVIDCSSLVHTLVGGCPALYPSSDPYQQLEPGFTYFSVCFSLHKMEGNYIRVSHRHNYCKVHSTVP